MTQVIQTGGSIRVIADPRGITSAVVDGGGYLQITYTDGVTQNAGYVVGAGGGTAGVSSFNSRAGAVSLLSADVTNALTYIPTSVVGLTGSQTVAAFKTGLVLTKGDVGLSNVDNTADTSKAVFSATRLATARAINGVAFDGTAAITITANWSAARTLSYTGDAVGSLSTDGSANASASLTLATVNANVGTFGSATQTPVITVNAKGLVTAISTVATSGGGGGGGDMFKADNLSGLANYSTARSNLGATTVGNAVFTAADAPTARTALGAAASGANTDITSITGSAASLTTGRTISLTGDVSYTSPAFNGTSNVTAAATLATVNSNVGSFGGAFAIPTFTVNAKGLMTAAGSATPQVEFPINFTAAADAYVPARIAMTISQGNAPLGTGSVAYSKSTAAAPSTFNTTTLPATLEAGAWLKVSATGVTGFYALDLYRSA